MSPPHRILSTITDQRDNLYMVAHQKTETHININYMFAIIVITIIYEIKKHRDRENERMREGWWQWWQDGCCESVESKRNVGRVFLMTVSGAGGHSEDVNATIYTKVTVETNVQIKKKPVLEGSSLNNIHNV